MHTKKLLSLVLALVMVCSMMATLTVTSFAILSESYVGDTMVFRITGQLSNDEEEGNVKSIAFVTGTNPNNESPYVDGEILSTEQVEEIIEVTVKAINAGDVSLSYQRYSGGSWENGQTRATSVYPTIAIGETITCTIPGRTLYPDNPDGNIKNITAENAAVVSAVQNGEDVDVTLKATSVGTICVTFDEKEEGALDFSSNDEMVVAKAVPADNYLDLDENTTEILDSKTIDQNYNLTVEEGTKTDMTKVKLTWTISDINAARTDSKIWDTTELKWVDVAGTPTITDNGTATFKLENYSSVKVDAAVTFDTAEYEEGKKFTAPTLTFDEITGTDGKITLDTANGNETYSKTNVPTGTIHVTVKPGADDFKSLNATTTAKLYGVYTVTISECTEEQPGGDCLAKGTKITMANGTLKNIEDITEGDEVLTYNHEAGRFEAQKVYLAWAGESPKCAFTLHFTNGIEISVIGDHCFFEKESLSYVAIFDDTAEDFIGKHFYNAAAGRYEELLCVTYDKTPVDYYEIYTEYNANCIAEGMLNVAYDSSEMLNIYNFYEDLTIDHEQLASDIAEYGIFEYVENDRYSKKIYDALGWKYGYVMIGKGFGTADEFRARMDAFLAD